MSKRNEYEQSGMKISEMIESLRYFQEKFGDKPVTVITGDNERWPVKAIWGPDGDTASQVYVDAY